MRGEAAGLLLELTAAVRREPGNLRFDPYTQAARPAEFFVFEAYRDEAAFQAHLAAEHGARFNAALANLIEEDASGAVLAAAGRACGVSPRRPGAGETTARRPGSLACGGERVARAVPEPVPVRAGARRPAR